MAAGYSPGMGFIHTGKMLSFVYDIADLYKADFAIPAAFDATAAGTEDLESRVRKACRDAFRRGRLLGRIVDDVQQLLDIPAAPDLGRFDDDAALPGGLWDPVEGVVQGGVNWADAWAQSGAAGPGAHSGQAVGDDEPRPGSPADEAPNGADAGGGRQRDEGEPGPNDEARAGNDEEVGDGRAGA